MNELRVFRTFTWELACSPDEVRYGGSNPVKLVAHDELQYRSRGAQKDHWISVPVVEAARPEHPQAKRDREAHEQSIAGIQQIFRTALEKS